MNTPEQIAKVCHEVNRAYQTGIGELVSLPWELAAQWERDSAIAGVKSLLADPTLNSEALHKKWMEHKKQDGWKYGTVKDPILKTHPCMVEYYFLPQNQRIKDHLFGAVVKAMR